ncbi:MAG: Mur ligase family protein [Minisyncoccia bacterium]
MNLSFIKKSSLIRKGIALLANLFYGFPSRKLIMIGVTGSNGKTTTTYIIRHLLIAKGFEVGLIGTSGYWINNNIKIDPPVIGSTPITTPDPFPLQKLLRQMVNKGTKYCVMEVSSAGLRDWRIWGINFKVGILTSLADIYHVELHGNFENYKNSKRRLFEILSRDSLALLPLDNPFFEEFKQHTKAKVVSFGINPKADINGHIINQSWNKNKIAINAFKSNFEVETKLKGEYNLLNILSAVGTALFLNVDIETIKNGLNSLTEIPGRFEIIEENLPFKVIIDKANSTEAFLNLIKTVKLLKPNRIIGIYGNFHDYSLRVRKEMAEIALNNFDLTIITTDDPKDEDPQKGINDFINYAQNNNISPEKYLAFLNRREAIKEALLKAQPNDVVLILGRGDEKLMNIKGQAIPFNDKEVALELIKELNLK